MGRRGCYSPLVGGPSVGAVPRERGRRGAMASSAFSASVFCVVPVRRRRGAASAGGLSAVAPVRRRGAGAGAAAVSSCSGSSTAVAAVLDGAEERVERRRRVPEVSGRRGHGVALPVVPVRRRRGAA